jgi:hypothetical protein
MLMNVPILTQKATGHLFLCKFLCTIHLHWACISMDIHMSVLRFNPIDFFSIKGNHTTRYDHQIS